MSTAEDAAKTEPVLTVDTVFAIQPLELRARVIADSILAGAHRSKRFGSSSEFAEHKLYTPGDDLRRLDWRAFARMDRYFVRRMEEESRIDVALVVDTSGSMGYAGGARGAYGRSKLEVACTLAAAIAWLAAGKSDATAVSLFAGSEHLYLPPTARRDSLAQLMRALEDARPKGETHLRSTLEQLAERLARRTFVVVLSDLIDTGTESLEPLGVLRKLGCDALVLQTMHRDELDFPFDGVVRFEDLEGAREVQVDAPLVRSAYLDELRRFLDDARDAAGRLDVRWHLAPTDDNPAAVLAAALSGARGAGA